MPTTSDYLTQLEQDREDLVDNLETKGITGLSGDETFTELVPEVLNIPSGSSGLDWSAIGYSGEPKIIQDGYDYAKNIYDNWDSTQTSLNDEFKQDYDLIYLPLVDTSNATSMRSFCQGCAYLENIPLLNTSNVTDLYYAFSSCGSLKSIPLLDTSSLTSMRQTFNSCNRLEDVPVLNTSSLSGTNAFSGTFGNCPKLTDQSLDNILQMCINATSYNGTKTLARLGFNDITAYPVSRIQALTHYQDFIDAGWTIS